MSLLPLFTSLIFFFISINASLPPSPALNSALKAMTSDDSPAVSVSMEKVMPALKSKHEASKHMIQLYDLENRHQGGMKYGANIVRSVVPVLAALALMVRSAAETQIHFNVDRPNVKETIVGAVLHMSAGHRIRRNKHSFRHRRTIYVTGVYPTLTSLPRLSTDRQDETDTLTYNALPFVADAMTGNSTGGSIQLSMVLSRFQKKIGGQRDLSAKKVHRRHSPFLLLYIKSDSLINIDAVEETPVTVSENFGNVRSSRAKRSIVDPKYFLYRINGEVEDHTVTTTTPQPPARPRKEILNARAYLSQGPELFHDQKEMKQNRRKNRLIGKTGNEAHKDACKMHELSLKFDEIGWKHTIIAPRELKADYCKGDCEFPLKRATAPSNHALLQSLLHHVGETDIPPVCCAPSKMDSLTLLYFDKRENIVLKSFPKMLIKACGCM